MKVVFDVQHLYYLPQYLPVIDVLKKFTQDIKLSGYKSNDLLLNKIVKKSFDDTQLEYEIVEDWKQALSNYLIDKPHWIIFGNAVSNLDQLHRDSKTVLMQHGVGPKSIYYEVSKNPTSVRFVEGIKRLSKLNKMFPDGNFIDSGFAKLDPAINKNIKLDSLSSLGLDENKPTLLYAPTFYPSSIELFSKNFPNDFKDFNIILKPHFFSLTLKKYKAQKLLLETWEKFDNVYLTKIEDYNLLNFIYMSDDQPYLQIGEIKYGKPILDRMIYQNISLGDDWKGKFDNHMDQCEVIYLPRTPSISTKEIIEVVKSTE